MILPLPIFTIPPIAMALLEKLRLIPKGKMLRSIMEVLVLLPCLTAALPLSCAIFPQQGVVSANKLEKQFQDLKGADGQTIE
jgi:hypothetical protein